MIVNDKALLDRLGSYLGLAMRAGKLVSGDEVVLRAVRSNQAKVVFIATDASDNTKKKYRDKCNSYDVPLLELFSRMELGQKIGKDERVVVAVTDTGLARQLMRVSSTLMGVKE